MYKVICGNNTYLYNDIRFAVYKIEQLIDLGANWKLVIG